MNKIGDIIEQLDSDECLALGQSPWEPNVDPRNTEIHQVDWDGLFPSSIRPLSKDSEGYDWELYGDGWELNSDEVDEIFEIPPGFNEIGPEEWDVCAWYQPLHFHGFDWGIFIKETCIRHLAKKIYRATGIAASSLNSFQREALAKSLIRAAFSIFYRHELYHHKTECLGFRIYAIKRRSAYLNYFNNVYKLAAGTDSQIEEALANAFMYRELNESFWLSKSIATAARAYLIQSFPSNPPGYRLAPKYLSTRDFYAGQDFLFSQVLEGTTSPINHGRYWSMAPRANQSFFNIRSEIWTIVPKGKKPLIPTTATPLRTCSSDQIVKVCGNHGYRVTPGGKGSHIKLKRPGSATIIVPGNRDNVSPGVTKNILEILGYKISDLPNLL